MSGVSPTVPADSPAETLTRRSEPWERPVTMSGVRPTPDTRQPRPQPAVPPWRRLLAHKPALICTMLAAALAELALWAGLRHRPDGAHVWLILHAVAVLLVALVLLLRRTRTRRRDSRSDRARTPGLPRQGGRLRDLFSRLFGRRPTSPRGPGGNRPPRDRPRWPGLGGLFDRFRRPGAPGRPPGTPPRPPGAPTGRRGLWPWVKREWDDGRRAASGGRRPGSTAPTPDKPHGKPDRDKPNPKPEPDATAPPGPTTPAQPVPPKGAPPVTQPNQPTPPPKDEPTTGLHRDDISLQGWGKRLNVYPEAINSHLSATRQQTTNTSDMADALSRLANQADNELPVDKRLVSDIQADAAALRKNADARAELDKELAAIQARADTYKRTYETRHDADIERGERPRGGGRVERRADYDAAARDQ